MVREDLFDAVRRVPITRVMSKYLKLTKRGSFYDGLCPFHGDTHLGSFRVTPSRNHWHCFACGQKGDGVAFVSLMENISPIEAATKIALEEKIISAEEAETLRSGNRIGKTIAKRTVCIPVPVNKPREKDHCAAVYEAFVKACAPLSKEHSAALKNVRKIPDDEMGLFFEWPNSADSRFWMRFEEELQANGIFSSLPAAVSRVPGFAYDLQELKPYFMNGTGIGIKLFDKNRQLSGLQLRQDNAEGAKYKIFSSGWAESNSIDEPNKFDGASAKQVPDIVFPKGEIQAAAVTEGKFKALKLAELGYLTLSLNGVNSWILVLKEFAEVVQEKNLKEIAIFFDADMHEKPGVASAAVALSIGIETYGLKSAFIVWSPNCGKGIDDMLLAGHYDKLRKRTAEQEKKILQQIIDNPKSVHGNTDSKYSSSV